MEIQDRCSRSFLAGGGEWGGVFRKLRRKILCPGLCQRTVEMEVRDAWRAPLRRQAFAWVAAGRRNHAGSLRLLFVFADDFRRKCLFWQGRRKRIRVGRRLRKTKLEISDRRR